MKREIIIRNAEKEDVRQIAEILVEDWQKAYRGIMDDAFLDSMNVSQRCEIEGKRYQKCEGITIQTRTATRRTQPRLRSGTKI